ncbi:hypothetical protein FRX31_023026 [Thalictrum thalictroides]|uniref:Cysteine-rich receptor-like protein kinase n=1 Tax=Thalictrum thalictroides TaxID=46969 RepID=A0A7J6VRL0_THATH|nr:hypothetical protein FRX31_023026 [Thalictrum thalictroides]
MTIAVEDIKRLCPTNMEAIVWGENCQLRYSNVKFFGVMDYTTNITLFNKQNISEIVMPLTKMLSIQRMKIFLVLFNVLETYLGMTAIYVCKTPFWIFKLAVISIEQTSVEQTFHCRNSCYCSICSCGHFLVIYGKQKKKETIELTTREVYQNDVVTPIRTNSLRQRDEMRPKDFPLITLATINEITNHFSDLNILGQGGFGPVYKVSKTMRCNSEGPLS